MAQSHKTSARRRSRRRSSQQCKGCSKTQSTPRRAPRPRQEKTTITQKVIVVIGGYSHGGSYHASSADE